jgi:protein-disulfide isomerase
VTDVSNQPINRAKWRIRLDPYFLMGMLSVLLIAGVYGLRLRGRRRVQPSTLPASLFTAAPGAPAPLMMGRPGAPVRVVELMEYQCPACAQAHRANAPVLRRMADQGRIVFRAENVPLPSHPNAISAGVYAACVAEVSPHRFWEYHAALFEHQDEWVEKYAAQPVFAALAGTLGADTAAVRQCLEKRGEQIAATLRGRFRSFAAAGFISVPVWTVNGRIVRWDRVAPEIERVAGGSR